MKGNGKRHGLQRRFLVNQHMIGLLDGLRKDSKLQGIRTKITLTAWANGRNLILYARFQKPRWSYMNAIDAER